MTVSDNGGGFDWNSSVNDSFGFEMMHALVDQLGGTMNVESGSSGTRATIQFPTA
jgi:two-component sensor histidine kinase